jgi:hypothetical protein
LTERNAPSWRISLKGNCAIPLFNCGTFYAKSFSGVVFCPAPVTGRRAREAAMNSSSSIMATGAGPSDLQRQCKTLGRVYSYLLRLADQAGGTADLDTLAGDRSAVDAALMLRSAVRMRHNCFVRNADGIKVIKTVEDLATEAARRGHWAIRDAALQIIARREDRQR